MKTEFTIDLPPVKIKWDDTFNWSWEAPNGAMGTHESSFVAAATAAIKGMGISLSGIALVEPDISEAQKAAEDLRNASRKAAATVPGKAPEAQGSAAEPIIRNAS